MGYALRRQLVLMKTGIRALPDRVPLAFSQESVSAHYINVGGHGAVTVGRKDINRGPNATE